MVSGHDAKRPISVTFPESLLDLMERLLSPRERNAFIVAATEKALQGTRLNAAITSFHRQPVWSDEDHPELATDGDVEHYLRTVREGWMPRDWDALSGEDEALDSVSA